MGEIYAKNGKENDKFVVRQCKYEETKLKKMKGKMNSNIKVQGSGEMKMKGRER